jgi:hypothetical protein
MTQEEKNALARKRYAEDPEYRRKSRAATEKWEAANPGASYTPEYGRSYMLGRRHKMTPEQYEVKLAEQGGHCALCDAVQYSDKRRLPVDHDHICCPGENTCGKCTRGILCANCNRRVAFLEEILRECWTCPMPHPGKWLERAVQYLRFYKYKIQTQENSA